MIKCKNCNKKINKKNNAHKYCVKCAKEIKRDRNVKYLTERETFVNNSWDILPKEIIADRIDKLSKKFLNKVDGWAINKMKARRENRGFISSRIKTGYNTK